MRWKARLPNRLKRPTILSPTNQHQCAIPMIMRTRLSWLPLASQSLHVHNGPRVSINNLYPLGIQYQCHKKTAKMSDNAMESNLLDECKKIGKVSSYIPQWWHRMSLRVGPVIYIPWSQGSARNRALYDRMYLCAEKKKMGCLCFCHKRTASGAWIVLKPKRMYDGIAEIWLWL